MNPTNNQNDDQQTSDNTILDGGSTSGGETDNASVSTSRDSTKVGNNTSCEVSTLAKREGRNVRIWRRNVFLMLLVTAALLTSLTYIFLKEEDEEDFDTSFFQFASTIRDSLKFNLLGVIEATSGLSEYLTAEAIKTNSEWPFMTLSSFEVFVSHTRAQASSELIVVAPIVTASNLEDWSRYSQANQGWIDESFAAQGGREDYNQIPSSVYRFGRHKGRKVLKPEDGAGEYPTAPFWQMSRPPFDTSIINFNSLSTEEYQKSYDDMIASRKWVFGIAGPNNLIDYTISEEAHDALHSSTSKLAQEENAAAGFANHHPHTNLIYPVFQELNQEGSDIVAMVVNVLPWDSYLKNTLPAGVDGIYCILHNSDGQVFSYVVNGQDASYLGEGDFHDTAYDNMGFIIEFDKFLVNQDGHGEDNGTDEYGSHYWFVVYPSAELEDGYKSSTPLIFACIALAAFAFMTVTFVLYDWFVIRKNNKILKAATRSNAILSSLFPQQVKEKLLQEEEAKNKRGWRTGDSMRKYMSNDGTGDNKFYDNDDEIYSSKPIADLFPDATVLFADLVGFTAWSSTREPTAVFTLLETLFKAFDKIAARKRVYKVETIGDCYVAVTGLPDPNPKHAEDMCKFAKEIFHKMKQLTNKLEELLGPDTSSLSMRFGIHSGPVTAGVLRGERSRFQLFGDTMNTASRMESLGQPGKIHLSQETADLLIAAGKGNLIEKRKDKVLAKGKGELQTWWLVESTSRTPSIGTGSLDGSTSAPASEISFRDSGKPSSEENDVKTQRAIQWTVSCFSSLLKSIVASRESKPTTADEIADADERSFRTDTTDPTNRIPLEEVLEVIDLSRRGRSLSSSLDPESIDLPPQVYDQLVEYITTIAGMYHKHPFHNFEHASHVVMSVLKLLSRFQSCDKDIDVTDGRTANSEDHVDFVEKQSFGYFTQDPLIKFSLAFSALIHDILHPGVSNDVLIKEEPDLAEHYKSRSVAEQRSLDEAWELLMEDKFRSLRGAIYQTREEEDRFRQLVINSLLATDIMDPDLKKLRTDRWNRAFDDDEFHNSFSQTSMDRKATIVIEHLIQTSDVSHTMQHWNVFRKWNERLFQEMYKAYMDGRSDKDPSEFWYKGEIGFFDFYVIPLAARLKQCGDELGLATGSDEYLVYAKMNRDEWESKGVEVVAQMKAQFLAHHTNDGNADSLGSGCGSAV